MKNYYVTYYREHITNDVSTYNIHISYRVLKGPDKINLDILKKWKKEIDPYFQYHSIVILNWAEIEV